MEALSVAVVVSIGPTLAALAAWRSSRASARHLGRSNGSGTVAEMVEATIERFDRLDGRLDRVDSRLERLERRVERH